MSLADEFLADAGATSKPGAAFAGTGIKFDDASANPPVIDQSAIQVHVNGTGMAAPISLADQFESDARSASTAGAATSVDGAPKHKASAMDRVNAAASGLNRGVIADLVGIPGDALANVIDLGKAGIGYATSKITGHNAPDWTEPMNRDNVFGTSSWIASKGGKMANALGMTSPFENPAPDDAIANVLHATGRGIGSSVAPASASGKAAMINAALMGGGSGASSEIVRQIAPNNPSAQIIAGFVPQLLGMAATAKASRMSNDRQNENTPPIQATDSERLAQALTDRENNAVSDVVKPRVKLNVDGSIQELPSTPSTPPLKQFVAPTPAPEQSNLNAHRQLSNIDLMKEIGLNEQRPSAISGNKFQAGIEYENTKLSNQIGQVSRDQLAKEQAALKDYAGNIVSETGASAAAPEAVGQSIRAPMQALSDHFDNSISKLYDTAKENAGELAPVKPDNLNGLLGDHDFRESLLSSPAGTTLLGSIERQVKRFQGIPVEGETLPPAPNTVNSAENLRKWLNAQWSPGNSRLVGRVKEALDTDVANAGGAGVFDQARALHGLRKDTLDNPNGIAKLLTTDGPNGINQAIPDEQVAGKLLAMPTAQFNHVIKTLRTLPQELAPQGVQAISEIQGELARRIYKAGDSGGTQNGPSMWNAANVTKELNAQKSKMELLFSPEQLKKFSTLHDAGYVLQSPTAYKGAAAQGYNYLQSGAIAGLPVVGAGIGAYLGGGPLGAAVGAGFGSKAAAVAKAKADASNAEKLAELLRNPKPVFSK